LTKHPLYPSTSFLEALTCPSIHFEHGIDACITDIFKKSKLSKQIARNASILSSFK
jgi:hypothetical protein